MNVTNPVVTIKLENPLSVPNKFRYEARVVNEANTPVPKWTDPGIISSLCILVGDNNSFLAKLEVYVRTNGTEDGLCYELTLMHL